MPFRGGVGNLYLALVDDVEQATRIAMMEDNLATTKAAAHQAAGQVVGFFRVAAW
jgi:hypothetical protein